MIVRVLRGHVLAERVDDFRNQARRVLVGGAGCEGLVHAHVGRQVHRDGSQEVIFVTVWRDIESLYRWVGGSDLLETPVLSERHDVFDACDVQHYEVLESWDPALPPDEGGGGASDGTAEPAPAVMEVSG